MNANELQIKYEELIKKCEGMMKDCGFKLPKIKYSMSSRYKRKLGNCEQLSNTQYEITLATFVVEGYLELGKTFEIEDVILHEMCHTLPKSLNHGEIWLRNVKVINDKYGYNIKRLKNSDEEYNTIKAKVIKNPVTISCYKCGLDRVRGATQNVVKNIEEYKCKCGGKLYFKDGK